MPLAANCKRAFAGWHFFDVSVYDVRQKSEKQSRYLACTPVKLVRFRIYLKSLWKIRIVDHCISKYVC